MSENKERINPFFQPYQTPHDTAPFDRIRLEDFEEAMIEGIRRDDEQIEKIINNPEKPTRIIMICCRVCLQYSLICFPLRPTTRWMRWHRR